MGAKERRNAANNASRSGYLQQTNRAIIVAVLALVFTAVPYSLRERMTGVVPYQVEITNLEVTAMPQMPGQNPSGTAQPVPPKPVPPENFDERGGIKPPKRPKPR